jgi:MYXO-CTERM domain-containing protein
VITVKKLSVAAVVSVLLAGMLGLGYAEAYSNTIDVQNLAGTWRQSGSASGTYYKRSGDAQSVPIIMQDFSVKLSNISAQNASGEFTANVDTDYTLLWSYYGEPELLGPYRGIREFANIGHDKYQLSDPYYGRGSVTFTIKLESDSQMTASYIEESTDVNVAVHSFTLIKAGSESDGAGGGCNTGFGALAGLFALGVLRMIRRKRP